MHAIWDARSGGPDLNRAQRHRDLKRDASVISHSALWNLEAEAQDRRRGLLMLRGRARRPLRERECVCEMTGERRAADY